MVKFKIFLDNRTRITMGGTGYHELQYCKKNLPIKKLTNYKNIKHWQSDSLYIEAVTYTDELFYKYYDEILGQYFKIDYFGINYFAKAQAKKILEDISQKELPDKEIFINWLNEAVEKYNGFYILGV